MRRCDLDSWCGRSRVSRSCSDGSSRYCPASLCLSTASSSDLRRARCKRVPATGKIPRRRTCPRYFHGTRPDRSEYFFFSSRRRHTRLQGDWSSDVCSSDLLTISTSSPSYYSTPVAQGNYAVSVTASSGSLSHSTTVSLVVGSTSTSPPGSSSLPDRKSVV